MSIIIKLNLDKDSTYNISVFYFFDRCCCGRGELLYTGKYIAEKKWIYFNKPSPPSHDPNFPFSQPWEKLNRKASKMFEKGYHSLKISDDKVYGKKIYFDFNDDCFKKYWENGYVIKLLNTF